MKKKSVLVGLLALLLSITASPRALASPGIVTSGTLQCAAQWNELCEDKKIISVPEKHILCGYQLSPAEKNGETFYQIVASDNKSITVYFKAKGNQDRFKPQGAMLKLNVSLQGVLDSETCEEVVPVAAPAAKPLAPPPPAAATPSVPETPAAAPTAAPTATNKPHACACSQWMNWMKLERCLEVGKLRDGIPCHAYNAAIECVASRDECRDIQKESCPQVVGLNQTTSMKRLYVENSPVCQQP